LTAHQLDAAHPRDRARALAEEAQDAVLTIEREESPNVLQATVLEHAGDDRRRVAVDVEAVDIQVPEDPPHR